MSAPTRTRRPLIARDGVRSCASYRRPRRRAGACRPRIAWPVVVALLLFVGVGSPGGLGALSAGAAAPDAFRTDASEHEGRSPASADRYAALLPKARAQAAAAIGEPDHYRIDARFDPRRGVVTGEAGIAFVNRTGEQLDDIFLLLGPNADYSGGAMVIDGLRVAGRDVDRPSRGLSDDETALRVPVAGGLNPGDTVAIDIAFTTTLTSDFGRPSFLGEREEAPGTWFLYTWYPMLAQYEPSRGWLTAGPVVATGRAPWNVALYDVTLTAPPDLRVITTGGMVEERRTGAEVRRRYVAGPTAEFAVIADEDFTAIDEGVGGTTVTVYADPAEAATARQALGYAARALEAYSDRFGVYPFTELDLVQTPLRAGGGHSSEGLIVVGSAVPQTDGDDVYGEYLGYETDPERADLVHFEHVVAHEVAHQWFGNTIRSDYGAHAFMVEGLADYVALTQLEATRGEATAKRVFVTEVAGPYTEMLESDGDQIADRTGRRSLPGWLGVGTIYDKAALGFLAISTEIGDEAFDEGLAAYARAYMFGVATPTDLRGAFERASATELDETWRVWFEASETTREDVGELLRAAA